MALETVIHGHDNVIDRFRRGLETGRLASSFLFVGPPGVGKKTLALKIAQALLCDDRPEEALDPCGSCSACQQVSAGTHPDLQIISKPPGRSFIPVELFVGDREHRMRTGLCHDISLKPFCGGRKIAIIDDADYLNQEGANSLLKTLEEPPPRSLIFLIGTSEQKQLPTIRSRCQIVRFAPLLNATVAELLLSAGHVSDAESADRMAQLANGSVSRAVELIDSDLYEMRGRLLQLLSREPPFVTAARDLNSFIEAAGSDAARRRQRFRLLIQLAIEFYEQLVQGLAGRDVTGDPDLTAAVRQAVQSIPSLERAVACLDCCLETLQQLESNVNQSALVECWLDQLVEVSFAGR